MEISPQFEAQHSIPYLDLSSIPFAVTFFRFEPKKGFRHRARTENIQPTFQDFNDLYRDGNTVLRSLLDIAINPRSLFDGGGVTIFCIEIFHGSAGAPIPAVLLGPVE